jgi:hypothetical protein
MQDAIRKGNFSRLLAAADAYSKARLIFDPDSNCGAEDFVSPIEAAKFRLGQAVEAADTAGIFVDKPKEKKGWEGREFKVRKSFDYDLSEGAKVLKENLDRLSDEYLSTLIYAEALDESQVKKEDDESGKKRKKTKCDGSVLERRTDHEMGVVAEGSANSFAGHLPEEPTKAIPSKRGRGGLPSTLATRFFSRAVAGDSCFVNSKTCRNVPCASAPRREHESCTPGQSVAICEPKAIPVRCPGK